MRKNRSLVLIISLFFLVFLHSLHALEVPPSISPDKPESPGCSFQTVSKVIDGDTFNLPDGTKVRLIGVDTPEINDPRRDVQWFGRESSKKLRDWIEGETVCLKRDRDKTMDTDKYGRLLLYVWKYKDDFESSGIPGAGKIFFVNAELIKQGFGFAYTRYPFQYLEDFRKYERKAREKNIGIWNKEEQEKWEREMRMALGPAGTCAQAKTICPEDARHHIGKDKTVRFFVKKSFDSGKAVFLNSKNNFKDHNNFTAVIFEDHKNHFPPSAADFYWGKTVDVTGKIMEYDGRAEIILQDSAQISVIGSYSEQQE